METHPQETAARARLDRLENYLRQDPHNQALLIEAFETALGIGDFERARHLLAQGQASQPDDLGWRLREGDFWLAQRRHGEARAVLEAMAPLAAHSENLSDVVAHNLAFIDLCELRFADGVQRIAHRMEPTAPREPTVAAALALLWLRLLHHDGQLERAMTWTRNAEKTGDLTPAAAGIASLIAIDASDFAAAERWSLMDLQERDPAAASIETLIAQASLALFAQDAQRAKTFSRIALRHDPAAGRAWSALGFAELLTGNFNAAIDAFDKALATMPGHIGTWHGRGWTQILQGRLDEAQATFEKALALDRNFAESHGGLAVVLAMRKRVDEANAQATLALKLDADNVSGRYAQALLRGEIRNPSDLQRLAHRLLGAAGIGRTAR